MDILTVHQRRCVHKSQSQHQTAIDPSDDLLLLLRSEGIDVSLVGEVRFLRDGLLEVTDIVGLLLNIVRHSEGVDAVALSREKEEEGDSSQRLGSKLVGGTRKPC